MYISISMILILVTKVLLSSPTCRYAPRKGTSRLEVKGIPALIEALNDSDNFVREHVIDSLGKMRYMQPLRHLEKLLEDSDPEIRDCARNAIQNIMSARATFDD